MESKKILIVDDSKEDVQTMVSLLEDSGYSQIDSADSGNKAMEKVKSFKPDVVIIDVILPDMDGFDVCMKIRALGDKEPEPKIIMITRYLDKINAKIAVASGANEIIEKRQNFKTLCETVDSVFGKS